MMRRIDAPLAFGIVATLLVLASEYITAWVHLKFSTPNLLDPNTWISIGTLVLAGFAFAQWRLSAKTAKRQLRAYLSIGACRVKFLSRLLISCEAKLKNCGQTPAYFIQDRYDVFLAEKPGPSLKEVGSFDTSTQYRASLSPSEETLLCATWEISEDERMAFEKDELAIWMAGEVVYKDAFEESHFVIFKSYSLASDFETPDEDRMNTADDGNEQS